MCTTYNVLPVSSADTRCKKGTSTSWSMASCSVGWTSRRKWRYCRTVPKVSTDHYSPQKAARAELDLVSKTGNPAVLFVESFSIAYKQMRCWLTANKWKNKIVRIVMYISVKDRVRRYMLYSAEVRLPIYTGISPEHGWRSVPLIFPEFQR